MQKNLPLKYKIGRIGGMLIKIQDMKSQNSADATYSQNKSQKRTISLLHGTSLEDCLEKTSKTPGFKRRC